MSETPGGVEDQIGLNCGFLSCGQVVVQPLSRGRRKEFCSETCRRAADRDYKRARSRVDVLDEQLRKSQHHAAAYGRKADAGVLTLEQIARIESDARVALARAEVALELGASPERAAAELVALVAAVQPLLRDTLTVAARLA